MSIIFEKGAFMHDELESPVTIQLYIGGRERFWKADAYVTSFNHQGFMNRWESVPRALPNRPTKVFVVPYTQEWSGRQIVADEKREQQLSGGEDYDVLVLAMHNLAPEDLFVFVHNPQEAVLAPGDETDTQVGKTIFGEPVMLRMANTTPALDVPPLPRA